MATSTSTPRKKGAGLLGVLRVLVSIGLLALVAWFVPWRDRLTWEQNGVRWDVPGEIVGEWRADSVGFRIDDGAALPAECPPEVEAAAHARTPVVVTRVESPGRKVDWRPGMLRIFRELDPRGLFVALGMMCIGALLAISRWHRLLAVAGCVTTYANAFRLTFLGLFFNLIVPGLTGGDLVKAVLVVREHPERRADALVSVVVDRGLGLIVLIGLAAGVTLVTDSFHEVRLAVVATFVGILLGLWVFLHPFPRRILRVERILARLPQKDRVASLDRALRVYGAHPFALLVAVLLSIANHGTLAYGLYELARAFGDTQLTYWEVLGAASIANTVSSIPISPGGWGVGEAAYGSLFHMLGAPATLGIAVSVTFRLLSMLLGLFGGVFLLLPGGRSVRAEIAAESEPTRG